MSDHYELELPGLGVTFIADRLRRDRHELQGELTVRCSMPGARTVNGVLNTSDFNFSSLRTRQDRAKLLAQRAQSNGDIDWFALLEDFCQKVFDAERTGDPAVKLRDLPRPERDDEIQIDGLTFPRQHPSILFGDGGSAKSYTALFVAGTLVQRGLNVAVFDWELSGEDHRDRLERLFPMMPENLYYVRCERPLTAESDRLRRIVREHQIGYAVYDSIAFACDARPEDADVAGRYFRAVRSINCGSLHIAHINKSDESDKKPFGSSFWHNGARSTWNVQAVEQTGDGTLRLGLFNRKSNLGPLRQPVGYEITFTDRTTEFRSVNVADSPDLAQKLSVWQRMNAVLKRGSMTVEEITEAIDATSDAVRMAAKRGSKRFVLLDGGRIGLRA